MLDFSSQWIKRITSKRKRQRERSYTELVLRLRESPAEISSHQSLPSSSPVGWGCWWPGLGGRHPLALQTTDTTHNIYNWLCCVNNYVLFLIVVVLLIKIKLLAKLTNNITAHHSALSPAHTNFRLCKSDCYLQISNYWNSARAKKRFKCQLTTSNISGELTVWQNILLLTVVERNIIFYFNNFQCYQ